MAVLQAARARALGLNSEEAKSWGLNRALFYAAAKRGWENAKAFGMRRPVIGEFEKDRQVNELVYQLGGEKAFVSPDPIRGLRFRFGGRLQTPEQFDRQIIGRFDNWTSAWREAVRIIKTASPRDLQSQSRFFERVYKPRRDLLAEKWSLAAETGAPRRAA